MLFADIDNDGEGELITASDTIVILESTGLFEWEVAAELPNVGRVGGGAVIDVVRVADVDGDGLNEIIASGNSGAVTVYKHTYSESTKRSTYPVVWQSRPLVSAELGPMPDRGDGPRSPWAFTQGLAVGDVDGDGAIEIVVATAQFGQRSGAEPGNNGQIHVFEHTATRWFERRWLSDWTALANIPGIAIGDVDGDGNVGWVYNGTEIYDFDPATGDFVLEGVLEGEFPGQALNAIVSEPFEFNEPRDAVRLLPVKWDAPRYAEPGQTLELSVSLSNVWAEAHDVALRLVPEEAWVHVAQNGPQPLGTVPSRSIVDSPTFTVEIGEPSGPPYDESSDARFYEARLMLEITAAEGYEQTLFLTLYVQVPTGGQP